MSRRGIHRVTAESHAGRQMAQAKGARIVTGYEGRQFADHNRAVEEARTAELAARKARREKR